MKPKLIGINVVGDVRTTERILELILAAFFKREHLLYHIIFALFLEMSSGVTTMGSRETFVIHWVHLPALYTSISFVRH